MGSHAELCPASDPAAAALHTSVQHSEGHRRPGVAPVEGGDARRGTGDNTPAAGGGGAGGSTRGGTSAHCTPAIQAAAAVAAAAQEAAFPMVYGHSNGTATKAHRDGEGGSRGR